MTSRLRGLRPLMLATPVHALIRAVCGQLIRSSDALAIERRMVRRLGRPCGRFVLARAEDLPGRFLRKGELIGYVTQEGRSIVRVVVSPAGKTDILKLPAFPVLAPPLDAPSIGMNGSEPAAR